MEQNLKDVMRGLKERQCCIQMAEMISGRLDKEADVVQSAHTWTESQIHNALKQTLEIPFNSFVSVRERLLSQIVAWDAIIEGRRQFSGVGWRQEELPHGLAPKQFLLLFFAIQYRSALGITLATPSMSIKRSIEYDEERRVKWAKFGSPWNHRGAEEAAREGDGPMSKDWSSSGASPFAKDPAQLALEQDAREAAEEAAMKAAREAARKEAELKEKIWSTSGASVSAEEHAKIAPEEAAKEEANVNSVKLGEPRTDTTPGKLQQEME
ncbi:hypothetical protein BKA67DRAFT_558533 [Truncatella angustata]|uniref:Uncharacterized protein n=1 Tax=Truncatella angustata TaxID=152316 RepID=A0A9P9A359_9PEZI|nr:uncharacterized protein BKA67DRAFT_558533 [Truncatella angustata]KAH6658610.1 hypothetical protein BKA67DRAFT_558533 [Truncatella angustata]